MIKGWLKNPQDKIGSTFIKWQMSRMYSLLYRPKPLPHFTSDLCDFVIIEPNPAAPVESGEHSILNISDLIPGQVHRQDLVGNIARNLGESSIIAVVRVTVSVT